MLQTPSFTPFVLCVVMSHLVGKQFSASSGEIAWRNDWLVENKNKDGLTCMGIFRPLWRSRAYGFAPNRF